MSCLKGWEIVRFEIVVHDENDDDDGGGGGASDPMNEEDGWDLAWNGETVGLRLEKIHETDLPNCSCGNLLAVHSKEQRCRSETCSTYLASKEQIIFQVQLFSIFEEMFFVFVLLKVHTFADCCREQKYS
jgi:hypothetical protein